MSTENAAASTRLQHFVITPFEWDQNGPDEDGDIFCDAQTPFGSYRVELLAGVFKWSYCFDEYYDEDSTECESIEDGKAKAWEHWVERVSRGLTSVE